MIGNIWVAGRLNGFGGLKQSAAMGNTSFHSGDCLRFEGQSFTLAMWSLEDEAAFIAANGGG